MSPFDELLRDRVTVHDKDGVPSGPFKSTVKPTEIRIMDDTLVGVEEGDVVERVLPNGKVETYKVLEAEYSPGLHQIPASWTLHVRKDASLKPSGARNTTINIASANAIQIGDYNVQQISSVLQALSVAIDESNAAPEEKEEAKSKLAEFLRHPAVASALGAAAGAVARAVAGG